MSDYETESTAINGDISGGGISPILSVKVKIYNYDGTGKPPGYEDGGTDPIELSVKVADVQSAQFYVTATGLKLDSIVIYFYTSDGNFKGVSKKRNGYDAYYEPGDYIPLDGKYTHTFYVVSAEWDKTPIEYENAKVEYDGTELGTVTKGSPLTLECADKIMKSNVTITKT